MSLKISVEFDSEPLKQHINENFGIPSEAQRKWSELVFEGSAERVPSQRMLEQSRTLSQDLFSQGEIGYTFETGTGNAAHFLWTGLVMEDPETHSAWARPGIAKQYRDQEIEYTNPMASAEWTLVAAETNINIWEEEMQRFINGGF